MASSRALRVLALALLAGAVAAGAAGLATGQLEVALLLVFPIVYGTGPLGLLAVLLLIGAMLAWFASGVAAFRELEPRAPSQPRAADAGERQGARHGGVVLLGPIPIVWGSDPRTALWVALAALALALVAFALLAR